MVKRGELGVAVVGSGRIGTLRARLAAKHPSVGFLAVSDLDHENGGESVNGRSYVGLQELLVQLPDSGAGDLGEMLDALGPFELGDARRIQPLDDRC